MKTPKEFLTFTEFDLFVLAGAAGPQTLHPLDDGFFLLEFELDDWIVFESTNLAINFYHEGPRPRFIGTGSDAVLTLAEKHDVTNRRRQAVELFALALRLMHSGRLPSPPAFIHYSKHGLGIAMVPNEYGRLAYNLPVTYRIQANEIAQASAVWRALRLARSRQNIPSWFTTAEHLFTASHDPIDVFANGVLLIGAIEALLGMQGVRRVAGSNAPSALNAQAFVDVRNAIAHGSVPAEERFDMLESLAREVIAEGFAMILGDDDKTWTRRRLIERCLAPDSASSIARLESHVR